jgi:hypothetical protein
MGQLTPRAHGLYEVYLICVMALSPIFFAIEGTPRLILWGFAAAQVILRLFPMAVHGVYEIIAAAALMALPSLMGFWDDPNARHLYYGLAFGMFAFWFLTDYKFKSDAWTKEAHVDTGVDITAQHLGLHHH